MRTMLIFSVFSIATLMSACSGDPKDEPSNPSPGLEPTTEVHPEPNPEPKVTPACAPLDPRTVPLELAAMPEAGEAPFVDALNKAKTKIEVMVYQMGYGGILDTLKAKAAAGVQVKVILDVGEMSVNEKYKIALEGAGAEVRWSDPQFPYMHAKVLIVDGSEAVISTGNYSRSYMLKERNFVVTDRDPADLAILKNLFESDFSGQAPDLSCTRLLVSPVNAKDRLLSFIESAKTSLVVESMQFGDYNVRKAVLDRAKDGVSVRVLLADPNWIKTNAEGFRLLGEAGIPAKTRDHLHAKAIVVDGKAAFVGSMNLSSTSINKNREVSLFTEDQAAVKTMMDTFEADWTIATVPSLQ